MVKYYDASIGCNWNYIGNIIDIVKRRGPLPSEILYASADNSIKI